MRGRIGTFPLRRLVPLSVTLFALCLGLTAIRLAIEGRFDLAVGAIILACVMDFLDGLLARLLKSASKFGAELDSLADCLNFGIAPPMLLYLWTMDGLGNFGWICALFYAICCALRLARFNTDLDEKGKSAAAQAWESAYFIGVPAPSGAGLVLIPFYLHFLGVIPGMVAAPASAILCIAVGLLMVSRIPTFSLKTTTRIRPDLVLPLLLMIAFLGAVIANYPWMSFTAMALLYIAVIPISAASYGRARAAAASMEESRQTPAPAAPPSPPAPEQKSAGGSDGSKSA